MTWTHVHNRGETLRAVLSAAGNRRDGLLPMDLDGVRQSFGDELNLIGALQLKWHSRLSGRIERELSETTHHTRAAAVQKAWRRTEEELPGVRDIINHYRAHPLNDAMAHALARSAVKEYSLLALAAGLATWATNREVAAERGQRLVAARPVRAA